MKKDEIFALTILFIAFVSFGTNFVQWEPINQLEQRIEDLEQIPEVPVPSQASTEINISISEPQQTSTKLQTSIQVETLENRFPPILMEIKLRPNTIPDRLIIEVYPRATLKGQVFYSKTTIKNPKITWEDFPPDQWSPDLVGITDVSCLGSRVIDSRRLESPTNSTSYKLSDYPSPFLVKKPIESLIPYELGEYPPPFLDHSIVIIKPDGSLYVFEAHSSETILMGP